MKNVVFWDKKPQFVPHKRHITSTLQSPAGSCRVRFEVFTTMIMKNAVFWVVTPCGSCENDVLEEGITFIIRVKRNIELGTMLAVTISILLCFLKFLSPTSS
jgi:hypothetical protein